MVTCEQPVHEIQTGDMLRWYVMRIVMDETAVVRIDDPDKYEMRSQMLEVHNVTSEDEGYYFCRVFRGEMIIDQPVSGTCLFVYGKSM